MSSGCATIASARLQSSGSGSSGGGVSMGSSMPRIRLAAQGPQPVGWAHDRHRRARRCTTRRPCASSTTSRSRPMQPTGRTPSSGPSRSCARWPRAARTYYRRTLLVAREGERIVGTADLGRPLQDNLHLADVEVRVLPEARRRGIGRALHDEVVRRGRADGRTTFLGEVYQPTAEALVAGDGVRAGARLRRRPARGPPGAGPAGPTTGRRQADGYEVLTWANRAPDDLIEAYARMRTQMLRDMPSGEVDWEPVVLDPERAARGGGARRRAPTTTSSPSPGVPPTASSAATPRSSCPTTSTTSSRTTRW